MSGFERTFQDPFTRTTASGSFLQHASIVDSRAQSTEAEMVTQNETLTGHAELRSNIDRESTRVPYPDACAHELFEVQVARDPNALAVVCKGRQLTYGKLNERANQVAHYLRQRGVGPESLVGVCLERSPELLIALLGVWKAGGAYIPLDPSYPKERLSFIVADTGLKILLTDHKCGNFSTATFETAVRLDFDWGAIAQQSTENPNPTNTPSNLAYVMYTSGSTGQPKGVMIQHNGLVNYLCWAMNTYAVDKKGSVPIHSSISFDSTVASLYPPLLAGGHIELLVEDMAAQNLLGALRRGKNRSKLVVTPAHLELLNQQLRPEEMAGLTKVLVIAGEALSAERLAKWRKYSPETRLFNEYGPTETTVGCSAYEILPTDPATGSVPIGTAISNAELYVLDAALHPVTPGATGELYVGGAGVGRGYLNKPELTRERFLPNPFSGRSGERMYKTGDLVRRRADGALEFLGRADDQVKLRGYRIELGEIEATLSSHPAVQSCTVLTREDTPGNKQLVAYFVARDRGTVEMESLGEFLKQRLPDYMVPTYAVCLDSFPLTRNGKIDRRGLPAPSYKDILATQKFVAPRTETEKRLAAIWANLLKTERIGIHDEFFAVGGNSLMAMRLASQILDVFGVNLSMESFFPSATIAGLTRAIEGDEHSTDRWAYAVSLQEKGTEPPFFWIGARARATPLSNQLGTDQPFFHIGFEPRMVDQMKAPYRVDAIARDFVLALREKQPQGPYRLGGYCLGATFAYEIAKQLTLQGQDVGLLAMFEPMNPFQSPKARLKTGVRRIAIRFGFRLRELLRLKIAEIPVYVRSRWEGFKSVMTDLVWRSAARSRILNRQLSTPDLEKLLFFAASCYKPTPLGCRTVIFRCKDWPMLSAGDPYFGWRESLTGRCETHEIPGDHAGIFSEPNVTIMADRLRVCLQSETPVGTNP
jgi:amino acid adenylation domain-containing protein